MTQKKNDLHRDTLAVREAVERSQYGENSEALYLTSGYVQPSAEAAVRMTSIGWLAAGNDSRMVCN